MVDLRGKLEEAVDVIVLARLKVLLISSCGKEELEYEDRFLGNITDIWICLILPAACLLVVGGGGAANGMTHRRDFELDQK